MREQTLFGELAARLAPHPENVATEGLCYLLRQYEAAWGGIRALFEASGVGLPGSLSFSTQATGDDGATPDLVGKDDEGREVLLVEAKFWAALTPHQPISYLGRLPTDRPSVLLFLAPRRRLPTLWPKLEARLRQVTLDSDFVGPPQLDGRTARLLDGRALMLVSWTKLLDAISAEAEGRSLQRLIGDVAQLRGLSDRMDSEAFLPLRTDDLAPEIGRRVDQFASLVDQAVGTLVNDHGASNKNLSTGGWKATYGRFFVLDGLGCFLCYSPNLWWEHGYPAWLCIQGSGWTPISNDFVERLRSHGLSMGLPVISSPKGPALPVELLLGGEESDVVADMVAQIMEVGQLQPTERSAESS